jgi:hypothetical protein
MPSRLHCHFPLSCLPLLMLLPLLCRPCPLHHMVPLLVDCCFSSLPWTGGVLGHHLPLLFSGQRTRPTLLEHSPSMPSPFCHQHGCANDCSGCWCRWNPLCHHRGPSTQQRLPPAWQHLLWARQRLPQTWHGLAGT